jgi:hypothetical protein
MKLAAKNHHPKTTPSPQIHHQLTTKNHAKKSHFSKTPLKNTSKRNETPGSAGAPFFSKIISAKKPFSP